MQVLIIMQGPSGSGKSFIANAIRQLNPDTTVICSTDALMTEDGVYNFRPELLGMAHYQNLLNARKAMNEGKSVIIDNTNIRAWEARGYVEHAVTHVRVPVCFIRCTNTVFTNVHGVPDEVVQRMRDSMEDLTVDVVLTSKTPWEVAAENTTNLWQYATAA